MLCTPTRIVKENVLPSPGWLSTQISPCIISTSRRQIARPSPVPPYLRAIELSACAKAPKIFCCVSAEIPTPVSLTANCSTADSALTSRCVTLTRISPRSVNLIAFPTRLMMICRIRPESPLTASGTSGCTS
jgi:hypothetical protein